MINRTLEKRLQDTERHILVLGARQVGKTTMLRTLSPAFAINLANETELIKYSRDPGLLVREVRALDPGGGLISIDEVQREPRLLNSVQVLIDEGVPYRFVLTGSSARKLRRGRANLLPGRVILEYLDPLTVAEVGSDFELNRAMRIGCLPGIYQDEEYGSDILDTYVTTYLREEIQAEALVRNIGSYARFIDVAAASSGHWINYSKLASDAEIPKETLRRFYSVLEDTLVAFRIPPFRETPSHRRVTQRDKFLLFDIGVRNALLGLHRRPIATTEVGSLFEQLVALQCIYFNRAHRKGWTISSYRTHSGVEVDLVITTGEQTVAIECKAGRQVREAALRGLRSFEAGLAAPVKKYVVYRGDRRQVFSCGELAVPWMEFLLEDLPRL
jgi:predicted AAA+ superfamily ATPase